MCAGRYLAVLLLVCYALFSTPLFAQENSGWRISPENINIQMGTDRPLQLLDDSAQELDKAAWAVDNPDLAEIQIEDGITVLHPKAVGTVVVTATLGEETRTRTIKIWSALRPIPPGSTNWGLHPIGREIGDFPARSNTDGTGYLFPGANLEG